MEPATSSPAPASDDEAFLDELLARAVEQRATGEVLDLDGLLAGRAHLADRARTLLRVAVDLAPVSAPQVVGRRLPELHGFTIEEEIGRGGMGIVYRARQEGLGRLVALKVLAPALMASPRARERFVREARALARLAHPHVVAVHEVFEQPELCAYAMEWVEGTTLARAIEASDPCLTATGVAQLGAVLAHALSAVHAVGLVHRDVKPGNVLLRPDGSPLLSDFGLVHDAAGATHTAEGQFVGTVAYAAPEQLRGEQASIGPWSDVFSLGVTLYHALARTPPFAGRSTTEILRRMTQGDWPSLRKVNPSVPRDLATIVATAMAAEPAARYPTAAAFAEDLERFLRREPIAARPAGPWLRLLRWIQRRPDLSLALAAAVVLLVVGLIATFVLLQEARAERDMAARRQYTAAIAAADAALRDSDAPSAREHLDGAPPSLRHWEWRYLASRLDGGRVIGGHTRAITRLAASPDGARLATAATDRYVCIWDVATGAELARLEHPEPPLSVAWSGDGSALVTGCDTKLCVWDTASWTPRGAWRVDDPASALAIGAAEPWLAVAHRSGRIGVHALATLLATASPGALPDLPEARVRFRSSAEVHDLDFNGHGHLAASTMQRVHVWDVGTGKAFADLTTPDNNWGIAWHPNGERIASGGGDGAVRVWDVQSGAVHRVCHGHSGRVFGLAWDAEGKRLASSATDRTIRLWNADGRQIASFLGHADTVAGVVFLPQDRLASAGSGATDASVRIWEIDSEHGELQRSPYGFNGTWIEPGPDSSWFPYFGKSRSASYVALASLDPRRVATATLVLKRGVAKMPIAMSRDGTRLAVGTDDEVLLYDGAVLAVRARGGKDAPVEPVEPVQRFSLPFVSTSIAFGASTRDLAVGDNGKAVLYDTTTGTVRRTFVVPGYSAWEMAFDPSGRELAVATRVSATIWDVDSGCEVAKWLELKRCNGLCFSPDGRYVAFAHEANGPAITIWDRRRRADQVVLRGHTGEIVWLAFSPDGGRLASGSHDRTVRLWDPTTGMAAMTLRDHDYLIESVAWSRDGDWLFSSARDGTMRLRRATVAGPGLSAGR